MIKTLAQRNLLGVAVVVEVGKWSGMINKVMLTSHIGVEWVLETMWKYFPGMRRK